MKFFVYLRYLIFWLIVTGLFWNNLFLRDQLQASRYARTKVLYSKTSAADEELVQEINAAERFVYFAIYTFTKQNISDALIAAKIRGLEVKGIVDANQITLEQEKPILKKLEKYKVPVKVAEKEDGLMHIKMLVTDKGYAVGSFNWTESAARFNDEVLEIGRIEIIRQRYLKIFETVYSKYK